MHHMYTVGLDVDKLVFTEKILLYAGNSYINSPLVFFTFGKIYFLRGKSASIGQSAGNFSFSTIAMAVTKNTYNKSKKDSLLISEHLPKNKLNPLLLNAVELGYFLAGLIEGDGRFDKKELHIIFSENDISLAYYLKKRIGYGNVYKIKEKKAVGYICKHDKGLAFILSLINGKLVSNYKYEELVLHNYSEDFNMNILPPLKKLSLDNHWLAGFTQVNGGFYINVLKSKTYATGYTVKLEFSIQQHDELPLRLLYDVLNSGNISQYSSGIWCYKSLGLKTAFTLINYFDKYNIFGRKYIDYIKFRKVYRMITEGKHLDIKGIKKIISIATKWSSETRTQEI